MKTLRISFLCRLAFVAAIPLLAVNPPSLFAKQEAFEGRVKMSMTDGTTEQSIEYFVKGDRMRVETEDPRAEGGAMIMNMKERELTMLMPEQRMYMTMPLPEIGSEETEAEHEKPKPTGESRTILGHTAQQYLLEDGDTEYEIWATDELGNFAGLHLPDDERPGASSARERTMMEEDFFPLLIIERRNGQEQSRVEVTEVEETSLADSLFEPPADYRGMDMPFRGPQ